MSSKSVSVVIPCFNEEGNLRETHRRVTEAVSQAGIQYEVVYVDDGSHDMTPELLRQLQAEDEHVRVVYFSRNFGHQFAVTAGLAHATGGAVIILDADLQDPPELTVEMIRLWEAGYEVVYGVRTDREGETRFKLLTARVFYRLIRWLSETEIPLDTGDFRLLDRKVVVWQPDRAPELGVSDQEGQQQREERRPLLLRRSVELTSRLPGEAQGVGPLAGIECVGHRAE